MAIPTIKWINGSVKIIDQRQLPGKLTLINCKNVETLWRAIKTLVVRGAPALGVAAAFGVLLGLKKFKGHDRRRFEKEIHGLCRYIGSARPTAVNLFNALERMKSVVQKHPVATVAKLRKLILKEALAIFEEDRKVCRAMGRFGAGLIKNRAGIMTVCNAGALATVDYGTALGVMYSAKKAGRKFKVFVCETRPLLQGARLTAWELLRQKIDTTLICDNMAATLMGQGKVDAIFTGADRIARNGDAANKIGTYNLAILADYHGIPFYIVAPLSTFDRKIKTGKEIPIEQRNEKEVVEWAGRRLAPAGVKAYNPAFDVTNNKLITAIVTERGIIHPPFGPKIKRLLAQYGKK